MKRSNLQKIYLKKKTRESLKKYKKQENYCSRLYKKNVRSFSVILIRQKYVTNILKNYLEADLGLL